MLMLLITYKLSPPILYNLDMFTAHRSPFTMHCPFTTLCFNCELIFINLLPGLRSRNYFGGVGKIANYKLLIVADCKEVA